MGMFSWCKTYFIAIGDQSAEKSPHLTFYSLLSPVLSPVSWVSLLGNVPFQKRFTWGSSKYAMKRHQALFSNTPLRSLDHPDAIQCCDHDIDLDHQNALVNKTSRCVAICHKAFCSASLIQLSPGIQSHYENTPIQIHWKFYHQKMAIFQIKNSDIFHISAQSIDSGCSLEPPRRGGSNEYPQSMFSSRNKENNVYPYKPQFYYIKVGFNGVKIT